jgi:hypothetical protein
MFLRKIINFLRVIVNAFKRRSQSEAIKPICVTVKAPSMTGIKYGVPKVISKK